MGRSSKTKSLGEIVDPKTLAFLDEAGKGNLKKVQSMSKSRGFEIDSDMDGVTALMRACSAGHLDVVKFLVGKGAGMWCEGDKKEPINPFMCAAYDGRLDIVRYFVEEIGIGDDINRQAGKSGRKTAADFALKRGDEHDDLDAIRKFAVLQYLLDHGGRFGEGVTDPHIVFEAAARGDAQYVRYCLVANAALLNTVWGHERHTLLHVAATGRHGPLTQVLIAQRAQVDPLDATGQTPLMLAAKSGDVNVVQQLMDAGALLDLRDASGNTPLHHGCLAGHLDAVRCLLSRDTQAMQDPHPSPRQLLAVRNAKGHTPLVLAFAGGPHVAVVQFLLGVLDGNVDPVEYAHLMPVGAGAVQGAADKATPGGLAVANAGAVHGGEEWKEMDAEEAVNTLVSNEDATNATPGMGSKKASTLSTGSGKSKGSKKASRFACLGKDDEEPQPVTPPVEEPLTPLARPPSTGARRVQRFLPIIQRALWGPSSHLVNVISREAFMAAGRILPFDAASHGGLIRTLPQLPEQDEVLYLSHRWQSSREPDPDGSTYAQVFRYLGEPEGGSVRWVWVDYTCLPPRDRPGVNYSDQMANVATAMLRSTHFLAVPQLKLYEPVGPLDPAAAQAFLDDENSLAPTVATNVPKSPPLGGSKHRAAGVPLPALSPPSRSPTRAGSSGHVPDDKPLVYSDLQDYCTRGWCELESSLALLLGLEAHLCMRWADKVAYERVRMTAEVTEDGVVVQGLGFRGAANKAVEKLTPKLHKDTGLGVSIKNAIFGATPTEDPSIPIIRAVGDMMDAAHEPQQVLLPFVRAALGLFDEGYLLAFMGGAMEPLEVVERLSAATLTSLKATFSSPGPFSVEGDRYSVVMLYLMAVAYLMGLVETPAQQSQWSALLGKPRHQLQNELNSVLNQNKELQAQLDSRPNNAALKTNEGERPPQAVRSKCNCVIS